MNFFWVSSNANLTFLLFLSSPSDRGTEQNPYRAACRKSSISWDIINSIFAPGQLEMPLQKVPQASRAGTDLEHSTTFFLKKKYLYLIL